METILNYLDNMFINLPQSAEVLRAKEDLAEMMEDKYNELIAAGKMENEAIGIVISEFGNIQELIDELEIGEKVNTKKEFSSSDFTKTEEKKHTSKTASNSRLVSELEADEYLFAVKQSAGKIAAGVFLCICSPIALILLGGLQYDIGSISNSMVAAVGITVLLCMVACAVGLFISAGMKLKTYEYLKKECFTIDLNYEKTLYQMWESSKRKFTYKIIFGVILCIVSVIPTIVVSMIIYENNQNEFPLFVAVAFLMVSVGVGVHMFITAGMEEESYKVILQQKNFSANRKLEKKIDDLFSNFYWSIIVIIYLVWSFTTQRWGITWIIWPLSGIIYGIINKMIQYATQEK